MPLIIPLGYAQISHFFTGTALPNGAAVTYGVQNLVAGGAEALAEVCHVQFAEKWMPLLNNSVTLVTTRAKLGPNATGPFAEFTDPEVGSGGGEPEPPNVAFLIEKRTAVGGRSGQGRFYLPGAETAQIVAGGGIAAATLTSANAIAAAWFTAMDVEGAPLVLLHSASSDPTPLTSVTVDPKSATQRRRLR